MGVLNLHEHQGERIVELLYKLVEEVAGLADI